MKKIIVVIGLGRFGIGLVNAFADKDVDVIAIDRDKNNVAKIGYLDRKSTRLNSSH